MPEKEFSSYRDFVKLKGIPWLFASDNFADMPCNQFSQFRRITCGFNGWLIGKRKIFFMDRFAV
mgnify:CR=1 FL=1